MATAHLKSRQPLHNFPLSFLKWGKKQVNNHRYRKSPSRDHHHRSSASESDEASQKDQESTFTDHKKPIVRSSCCCKNRFSFSTCCSRNVRVKPVGEIHGVRKDDSFSKNKSVVDEGRNSDVEESAMKSWKLRPRKSSLKVSDDVRRTTTQKNVEVKEKPENLLPKSPRLRGFSEDQNVENEKQRLSISHSREETEEKIEKKDIEGIQTNNLSLDIPKDESVSKKKYVLDERGNSEMEESAMKQWNLRPRKSAVVTACNEIGATHKNVELEGKPENLPKSLRLRSLVESQNVDKKEEKQKFSISLTREEIEEDFFVLTGSKLPLRPRKRPKKAQKQLDYLFPGLSLSRITPESYDVPDVPAVRGK